MIAVYTRVSTDKQTADSQQHEINQWIKAQGYNAESVTWYQDKESGRTLDRAKFKELERDIFTGKVKTVIVYKLDRLSRSLKDGINLISKWCEQGVRLVSITQQIDLSGVMGKMVATLFFGLAEIERDNIKARQQAGFNAKRARGESWGNGRKKGQTKYTQQDIAAIKTLRGAGNTIETIVDRVKLSRSTVYAILASA